MNYYKRDGDEFIKVTDLYGMYANTDGTYSKEKQENSYGVVVIHNVKEIIIAHLEVKTSCTWEEAIEKYKLPSRLQLLAAFDLKDKFDPNSYPCWTKEECDKYLAWVLFWEDGYVTYGSKDDRRYYVREFTTIKL